jgi:hypothetical protein
MDRELSAQDLESVSGGNPLVDLGIQAVNAAVQNYEEIKAAVKAAVALAKAVAS